MYECIKFMYIIIKNDRIIELWKFREGKLGFMKPCKILVDSKFEIMLMNIFINACNCKYSHHVYALLLVQ